MYSCLSGETEKISDNSVVCLMSSSLQMFVHVHKQFPLSYEELSRRNGGKTLVGSDEEDRTHPEGNNKTGSRYNTVVRTCQYQYQAAGD